MSKIPQDLKEKFEALTGKCYADQGKWFLNGFWDKLEPQAEKIWQFAQSFIELDDEGAAGRELDEFKAHKFLENLGQTLTVLALRQKLRSIDLDNNNMMALAEYLIFRYKLDVREAINAPQGAADPAEIEEAERLVNEAQEAVESMLQKLEEQKQATEAMMKAEAEAKAAEDEALKFEAEAIKAEEENKEALQALHDQEQAYKDKIVSLTEKSKQGGVVSRNRAKAELEQLKAEDPLPLRKAQLNQGAAVRKAEKARKAAEESRIEAENARKEAEAAREAEEEAQRQVEEAVEGAEAKLQEALDYLEEVKKRPGAAMGDIWWMEREIEEKKKYLPKKKAANM